MRLVFEIQNDVVSGSPGQLGGADVVAIYARVSPGVIEISIIGVEKMNCNVKMSYKLWQWCILGRRYGPSLHQSFK